MRKRKNILEVTLIDSKRLREKFRDDAYMIIIYTGEFCLVITYEISNWSSIVDFFYFHPILLVVTCNQILDRWEKNMATKSSDSDMVKWFLSSLGCVSFWLLGFSEFGWALYDVSWVPRHMLCFFFRLLCNNELLFVLIIDNLIWLPNHVALND